MFSTSKKNVPITQPPQNHNVNNYLFFSFWMSEFSMWAVIIEIHKSLTILQNSQFLLNILQYELSNQSISCQIEHGKTNPTQKIY